MRAITQTSRKEIIPLADETGKLIVTYRLAGVVVGTQTFTYESNTTEGSRLIRGELS